jgi:hypothetical protein
MEKRRIKEPLRICIALPSIRSDVHKLGEILSDVLSNMGHSPFIAYDGERPATDSDILLLIGDCHSFNGFAKLLNRCAGVRPVTVLWQIDPLPPMNFSEHCEKIGVAAFRNLERWRCSWRSKIVNACLTRSMRRKRKQDAYERIFRDFRNEMAKSLKPPFNILDEESCKFMMRGYLWLKKHSSQPWLDHVVCSIPSRRDFLRTRGIDAHYAPLGYHPILGSNLNLNRDIDVVFLGNTENFRRRAVLENITKNLQSKKMYIDNPPGRHLGTERTALLNRAAISLNTPMYPWETAGLRFMISMACGALVISEPIEDPVPYEPGVHFIQAEVADMPDVIEHYSKHTDERQAIVDTAYRYITQTLTMENSVKKILQTVCNGDYTEPTMECSQDRQL